MIDKNNTTKNDLSLVTSLTRELDSSLNPVDLLIACNETTNDSSNNRILLESCEINTRKNLKSIIVNKAAVRITCDKNLVTLTSLTKNGTNALNLIESHFAKQLEFQNKDSGKASKSIDFSLNRKDENKIIVEYLLTHQDNISIDENTRLLKKTNLDCLRQINFIFSKGHQNNEYQSFLCGLFSFDLIDNFEKLPNVPYGLNQCPDYVFYLAEELLVVDNENQQVRIFMNIFNGENQKNIYYDLSRKVELLTNKIKSSESQDSKISSPLLQHDVATKYTVTVNQTDEEYCKNVNHLKKQIVEGNIFQVVPSRTFSLPCSNEIKSYTELKESNPSPYMFFMQDQDFTLFGASPESALKYTAKTNSVELYPIAGTRVRGKYADGSIDHDLDKRLEVELKLDQKELSEHMMLVDLARNDIARISKNGSIKIPRLLEIDRYSQVMHLVSTVHGKLNKQLDSFHAYQACMNMGTLTGAPKIKATELIRQTEKTRRGSYGGAIGYINAFGDMDTCIVIRSAYCQNGTAYIQAGAGVVYDSIPASEAQETRQKAQAVINAIQKANQQMSQKYNLEVGLDSKNIVQNSTSEHSK